ncbi:MAG: 50S ribosomal protein L22 [Bacteroidia bacterium]
MGKRKHEYAEKLKKERAEKYFAILRNCPTSPRKMNQVAALVRGLPVDKALNILKYNTREAAGTLEKLLKSAINNYEQKTGQPANENLYIKTIKVDSGFQLKRLRSAPQGRAYRIRKRSNHVSLILDIKN